MVEPLKKIFISGLNGNMGKRYATILDHLDIDFVGADHEMSFSAQAAFCEQYGCDGIIVATPTSTHIDALNIFPSFCDVPILIEKPIGLSQLRAFGTGINVRMINQYEYLIDKDSVGITKYNYFKTGSDGLFWDCINIIGLANGDIVLENSSPIWQCMINGKEISIKDLDNAYVEMIKDWVANPLPNHSYIELAHKKVCDLIEKTSEKKEEPQVGLKVVK